MIERVEISSSGGSAIYGADAVAGVVNIITRQDFAGVELGSDYSLSAAGDGGIATAHAVVGGGGDHGHITLGAEYVSQDAVGMGSRGYSRYVETLATPTGPLVHVGSIYLPQGFFSIPAGNLLGLAPGYYTIVNGAPGNAANDYKPFNITPQDEYFNYAPYTFLQTPSQRGAVWLQANAQLRPSVEFFAEALAQRSDSRQQLAPSTYSSGDDYGAAPTDPATGMPVIPANNYYNPLGVDVPLVLRRLIEGGDRRYREVSDVDRVLLGLRGDRGSWHWETSLTWASNRTESFESGETLRTSAALAVGPSGLDASGHVVCGTPDPATGVVPPANIVAGCVPLNLFGGS